MQTGLVLALIELPKSPVQEIAGLARANREIAGAHIEEIEGMVTAIGDASSKRGARLDHDEAERRLDAGEASDGRSGAGEAATDHAHREG